MEELRELVAIPARLMPEDCEGNWEGCFHALFDYSMWLLTVLAGLLELYASGADYGGVSAWLGDTAKHFHEWFSVGEDQLSYYERLVIETIIAVRRVAIRLHEIYQGRGRVLEEALEWAMEQYRRSGGRQVGRARYYAGILLRETARAVLVDVSTRIAFLL